MIFLSFTVFIDLRIPNHFSKTTNLLITGKLKINLVYWGFLETHHTFICTKAWHSNYIHFHSSPNLILFRELRPAHDTTWSFAQQMLLGSMYSLFLVIWDQGDHHNESVFGYVGQQCCLYSDPRSLIPAEGDTGTHLCSTGRTRSSCLSIIHLKNVRSQVHWGAQFFICSYICF